MPELIVALDTPSFDAARGVLDAGDRGGGFGRAMRVDDFLNRFRGQQRRVAVDDEHLLALELLRGDLLQSVGRAFGIALEGGRDSALVEMRRDLGVMGVGDDLDVLRAGLGDGVEDVVEHGPAADRMEDFGNTRPHPGAVTGGEYDGR